ncbi:hypothetical protein GGS23DRAFT_228159 [Durotheca rogersii]|uniref:uncharacterized protein n=1 Tax=Durotheca rogersii TaxID=419775 RepID=UPI0022210513|nr:uncharacterized protein GGS23DRAFT_228159 [Durotheca rogersii]KAI5860545.1 hypothetical protein GGS23DRAFT_228159 [Durotheca rogersii]
MRFTGAVFFAGAALAGSTVYSTDYVTITSCGPTVTNCPAASTVTSSTVYPVSSGVVSSAVISSSSALSGNGTVPSYPTQNVPGQSSSVVTSATSETLPTGKATSSVPTVKSASTAPYPTAGVSTSKKVPEQPLYPTSVIPITYTTCVPTVTVSYSTITVTPSVPAGTGKPTTSAPGVYPTGGFTPS